MSAVHVVEGGRHPAVLDVPTGPLEVTARPAGAVKLSLVIPTYNESRNLAELVGRLSAVLDACLSGAYELLVVDDDSPDDTWALALQLADRFPALRVMRRRGEKGLSTAVIRGWQAARGEVLAVIDADLQHPPEVVERLWREIVTGADLAVASRHTGGGGVSDWSSLRRALSRGAQLLGLCVLPGVVGRVSDPMSGYFMVRRSAIAGAALSPLGYKILIEVIGRGRIGRIAEVGYVFRERIAGESKVTSRVYLEYVRHLVRLRLALLPPRFAKFAVVGLSGVAVDMAILWVLSGRLRWPLTPSKLVAAEMAMANNFLWNDLWTFGDLAEKQGYGMARLRRFAKFNGICAAGLVLSVGLLEMQVGIFRINTYVANAVAIAVTTGWNFWMNKVFSWSARQPLPTAVPAQRRAAGA
ncbi:MAG: glycosyltransferase [Deltaproteobacteria bacterium]|nr:MAG: glycosyltransferase [Deltaproteobacteria bacterium]